MAYGFSDSNEMKNTFFFLILLSLANFSFGQHLQSFEIESVGLPNGDFMRYQYDGREVVVMVNRQEKERIVLKEEQIKQIDSVYFALDLDTLKVQYTRNVMDGIHRRFMFEYDGKKKEIRLNNYYLEGLDQFLSKINTFLPQKIQCISFGDQMWLKPDTVIYFMPDFYLDTLELPEHYNTARIQCFKKGRFITNLMDSIQFCECRIYPMEKGGTFKIRRYWKINKLEDGSWKREYFNSEDQVFNTEYLVDIIPFEIVKEEVFNNLGARPSVIIYRYYKTVSGS